jgi:hypothetical protein
VRWHLGLQRSPWSLHRKTSFQRLNISYFGSLLQHDSGWAPLAGGLYLAHHDGTPRPDVWATGCWDGDGGILEVCGLEAKLARARAWGAAEVFVPEKQADGPGPGKLYPGLRAPADALRDYLAGLDAPPPPGDFDRCRGYYLRQPAHQPRTREFYWSHLLPEIARR